MGSSWEQIKHKLLKFKENVYSQAKRALKKEVPRGEFTRNEIRDTLVLLFNEATNCISQYWSNLDSSQKLEVKQIFFSIRDKVVKSFEVLEVKYTVPVSCIEQIDPLVSLEDIKSDEVIMAMSNMEFFNLASKIVPQQFDGSLDKLQSFVDALTLLQQNSQDHSQNALAFVKTRLTGRARDIITTETSLAEIINTLKSKIKGESSQSLTTKLLNLKQNHKEAANYGTQIESLTENLRKAFISEGVPPEVAERYSTEHAVRSLSHNANTEKARIIMEASTFKTVHEAVAKFVSINSESENSSANVFYTRHANFRPSFRRQNFHGRYQQNHNNSTRGQNIPGGRGRGNNNRYPRNYRHNGYSNNYNQNYNRNSNHAVRVMETTSGNESNPQPVRLGDEL